MEEKIYAMWLADALGPGSRHGKALIEKYGSFEKIHALNASDYADCGVKMGSRAMERLLDKGLEKNEKDYGFCNHYYFGVIEYTSVQYPKRLRAIADPPPVLYVRGRMIDFDDNVCIAVVGTRSYSDAGWNATYKVTSELAKSGAIIVTGLASGIDTAATRAALDFSGFSVGVTGTGIERVYPSENAGLFEEMYRCGLVISELSPFTKTNGSYFPVRNRLISGLCHGVLVGEGAVQSGAMITASHATEQGRHVFAIPGNIIGDESSGVNKLIREGATPVFEAQDILQKYYFTYPHRIKRIVGSENIIIPEKRSTKHIRVLGKKKNGKSAKNNVADSTASYSEPVQAQMKNRKSEMPEPDKNAEIMKSLSENEKRVYSVLSFDEYKTSDKIANETGLSISEITAVMTMLEISELVVNFGGGYKKI